MITSLFSVFLLVSSITADSHLRPKRFGHTHQALTRSINARNLARDGGLLGGLGSGLGSVLGDGSGGILGGGIPPTSPAPTSMSIPSGSSPPSVSASPSVSSTSSVVSTTTNSTDTSTDTDIHTAPPATTTSDIPVSVSSASSSPSTSCDGGLLGLGCVLGPILGSPTANPISATSTASLDPSGSEATPVPSNSPSSPPAPPTTSSNGGILGPILSPILTPILGPTAPTSPSATGAPISSSSSSGGGLLGPILTPILGPTGPASPPAGAPVSSSSSSDGGLLGPILTPILGPTGPASPSATGAPISSSSSSGGGLLGPILTPILGPTGPASPPAGAPVSSSSSSDGGLLGPILTPILGPTGPASPSATGAPISSSSSSDGGILGPILTPILGPTGPASPSATAPSTPGGSSDSGILGPITSLLPSILPSVIPTQAPSIFPPSNNGSTTDADGSGTITSGVGPTSVPGSGNVTTTSILSEGSIFPNQTDATSSTAATMQTISVPANSQLQFVTATSLVIATVPTTTVAPDQTDPDAVPTTTLTVPTDVIFTAAPAVPTLPSNLPSKLFPPGPIAQPGSGDALISILFKLELNWAFVIQNDQASGQLFLYAPLIISTALGLDQSQVKTYALEVQVPAGWNGDVSTLGTMYLAYIPESSVDTLAAMIRTPNSPIYNLQGVAGELASQIVPSASVNAVSSPNAGAPGSPGSSTTQSQKSKTRSDAIIGVCAALGGIAALVAIWWVVRYVQRKQAAKHRRLSNSSDPNISNGVYGTQHDDRRTSFFYAEDELRGGYEPQQAPVTSGETVMTQRIRNNAAVGYTTISAPVLQQNSLNW